jgi:hypothetical protein
MPNFKLVFATKAETAISWIEPSKIWGFWIMRKGQAEERIISAPSKQIAEMIAGAMLGEEIFPLIYLGQVLSVSKTDLTPHLDTFSDYYTWERVLHRLRLILNAEIYGERTFEGFKYFSPGGSGKKIKVGLKLNQVQRVRLLTTLPGLSL